METIEHLRGLFRYNAWANRRVVSSLVENRCERAEQIMTHLLITEQEYFERLWGKDSTGFDFWPTMRIQEFAKLTTDIAARFDTLLAGSSEDALDAIASYKTSQGIAYDNTWREVLTHVLLHSATHRGNIMLKLRESGFEPPVIDNIVYLREK